MLFKSVGVLGDCVSICERIYNTPIPLAYSRHTSRFLVIYVSTLPLVLVGALRWATLPVMVTVCWALFGILEIGNLVEEPFTAVVGSTSASTHHLLPLTEVCRTIRRDVRSIAQYTLIGKNYSVPTIQQYPRVVGMPDNFKVSRPTTRPSRNRSLCPRPITMPTSTPFRKPAVSLEPGCTLGPDLPEPDPTPDLPAPPEDVARARKQLDEARGGQRDQPAERLVGQCIQEEIGGSAGHAFHDGSLLGSTTMTAPGCSHHRSAIRPLANPEGRLRDRLAFM